MVFIFFHILPLRKRTLFRLILLLILSSNSRKSVAQWWSQPLETLPQKPGYLPGSFRFSEYVPGLKGKRVALVVNHTAQWNGKSLVDTLLALGVNIKKVLAPEHGFRGTAEAGEVVNFEKDTKTGLPLFSIYGKTKKPTPEMLADVDVLMFDIQDIGARFYTYISTMKLVMEASAEQGKACIILDRANPLGQGCAGPVLENKTSFLGAFPIPVVHGLTVGELALMAKARNWFNQAKSLNLEVVKCEGYHHRDTIFPEVAPSPNIRTPISVLGYPSICMFEGTKASVGRGTNFPFEVYGVPDSSGGNFTFMPMRKNETHPKPLYDSVLCYGSRVTIDSLDEFFSLRMVMNLWLRTGRKPDFFTPFFDTLAGNSWLRSELLSESEPEIKWNRKLKEFKRLRRKYLIYR